MLGGGRLLPRGRGQYGVWFDGAPAHGRKMPLTYMGISRRERFPQLENLWMLDDAAHTHDQLLDLDQMLLIYKARGARVGLYVHRKCQQLAVSRQLATLAANFRAPELRRHNH